MTRVDFLIVGQGLAGSLLAIELLRRDKKVAVISHRSAPCASLVAAGLYNPITGNRMAKTWKADVLFEGLEEYYRQLETLLGAGFLHPIGIYRPFTSVSEQNDWTANSAKPAYTPFIQSVKQKPHESGLLHDPFGGVGLKKAGYLDTGKFLLTVKKYLISLGCFIEELFYEDKLHTGEGTVRYGSVEAEGAVFCHGMGAVEGKFFSWLPFHALKGEILEIKPEADFETVFNRGCFILPGPDGNYKVGSTYNWKEPDYQPTEEGKEELLGKLAAVFKPAVEVVGHKAGVRPATRDRRPFLGRHPEHSQLFIFNGLGTKGVSLGPWFAREMADHITVDKPLSPEVNIQRFFSLYFEGNTEK